MSQYTHVAACNLPRHLLDTHPLLGEYRVFQIPIRAVHEPAFFCATIELSNHSSQHLFCFIKLPLILFYSVTLTRITHHFHDVIVKNHYLRQAWYGSCKAETKLNQLFRADCKYNYNNDNVNMNNNK